MRVFTADFASMWRAPSLHLSIWRAPDRPGTNSCVHPLLVNAPWTRHASDELEVRV
jgi:hypothetical protein